MIKITINRFLQAEHIRQALWGCYDKTLQDKVLAKRVTNAMDDGIRKMHLSVRRHREYGHNKDFIEKKFKTRKARNFAHTHLLGDFYLDIVREVIAKLSLQCSKNLIEPPYYEKVEDGKWGWDVNKLAIDRLIQNCFETFRASLKKGNRLQLQSKR